MIKLVIFDCDGILIESEPLQNRAYRQAFKEIADFDISEEDYALNVTCLGKKAVDYADEFIKYNAEETKKAVRKRKTEIYEKLIDNELEIVPGVENLIKDIKGKVPIIVVSASRMDSVIKGISKFNLQAYFDKIQSCVIDGVNYPKGEVLHKVIKEIGASPEETVIIEDTPKGLKAAKEAGIMCIICRKPYSKGMDFSEADLVVDSIKELNAEKVLKL